jgi:hypothetical protein
VRERERERERIDPDLHLNGMSISKAIEALKTRCKTDAKAIDRLIDKIVSNVIGLQVPTRLFAVKKSG